MVGGARGGGGGGGLTRDRERGNYVTICSLGAYRCGEE